MNRHVSVTHEFETSFKKLLKKYRRLKRDLAPTKQALESGACPGDKLSGVEHSVYKVRIKNSDNQKGKSGGYRLLYYVEHEAHVILLELYSKSESENTTDDKIRRIIKHYYAN